MTTTSIEVALFENAREGQCAAILATERELRLVALSADPNELREKVRELHPHLVVIDVDAATAEEATSLIADAVRAGAISVAIGDARQPSPLARAVLAGARAFVAKPLQPDELIATLYEVVAHARSDAHPLASVGAGQIVAVYGPKGGVGTTTVATYLAATLAARRVRTALIDLDLQFGDVGIALDLRSVNSVVDLVAHGSEVDQTLVDELFVTHRSGLRVLLAPESLAFADAIEPQRVVVALDRLRSLFDRVVCDLPSRLDDLTRAVLAAADVVVLVSTPELAALKDLQRAIVSVPALGRDERVRIVVNRSPSRGGVEPAEIRRALGRAIAVTIPSDAAVTSALNAGTPLVLEAPGAKLSRSFQQVADAVMSVTPPPPGPGRSVAMLAPAREQVGA
jgi:pilus assembly protein CpaE